MCTSPLSCRCGRSRSRSTSISLWPFLFIALGRHRPRFVAYAILAVVATRIILLSMKIGIYEQTYARADSLLVGCGAALLLAQRPPQLARWIGPATFVTVLATFAFMPWRSFEMMSFGFTVLAFICAALILRGARRTTRG